MADDEQQAQAAPKKSKIPLIAGVLLMLGLGAGSFYAVTSGLILAPKSNAEMMEKAEDDLPEISEIAFVPITPIIINLANENSNKLLRFHAQIEVPASYEEDVMKLKPRIADILNGYLRAVDLQELENPSALINLRAQILRRLQIVAGDGRINDVLIMEFVIT